MYDYTEHPTRPRCWRPDLIPAVLEWLDSIPAAELDAYFVGFGVALDGSFELKMQQRPKRGGPPKLVTFHLDHGVYNVSNDEVVGRGREIKPYHPDQLTVIANMTVDHLP